MHGNRTAAVLLFFAALLLAASASAAVAAHGGRVVTSHAAAAGTRASGRLHTASATRTGQLEEEVAPELSWAASLLVGGEKHISYEGLHAEKPACGNSCAAASGGPYTPGCKKIYGCRSGN
jgi:hypothetical protein